MEHYAVGQRSKVVPRALAQGLGDGAVMTDRCFTGGGGICDVFMFFLKTLKHSPALSDTQDPSSLKCRPDLHQSCRFCYFLNALTSKCVFLA